MATSGATDLFLSCISRYSCPLQLSTQQSQREDRRAQHILLCVIHRTVLHNYLLKSCWFFHQKILSGHICILHTELYISKVRLKKSRFFDIVFKQCELFRFLKFRAADFIRFGFRWDFWKLNPRQQVTGSSKSFSSRHEHLMKQPSFRRVSQHSFTQQWGWNRRVWTSLLVIS